MPRILHVITVSPLASICLAKVCVCGHMIQQCCVNAVNAATAGAMGSNPKSVLCPLSIFRSRSSSLRYSVANVDPCSGDDESDNVPKRREEFMHTQGFRMCIYPCIGTKFTPTSTHTHTHTKLPNMPTIDALHRKMSVVPVLVR